jgi:hypothetical protein
MHVPDANVAELHERGFTSVEGFLEPEELRAAQDGLWLIFPRPEEYFGYPAVFPTFSGSQFAGLRLGPFKSWAVNRLTFHPDLVDFAARVLGSDDLHLYKTELWAKYAGAIDYDQPHHRDFANHSLVVPKRADPVRQLTTFTLLSDVTLADGPTRVVPLDCGKDVPYWPHQVGMGDLHEHEVAITGAAGTLFAYRTDILHRGSQMTGERASRFAVLADYQQWGQRWNGKVAWPNQAFSPYWPEVMERATPRERCLFGFPAPGDDYWDAQTLDDVQARYPNMDMAPYRAS